MTQTEKHSFVSFESRKTDTNLPKYIESPQSVQLQFSFLNKQDNEYTEIFSPVMCRDYLSDILHLEHFNLPPAPIYGFSYDPQKQRIDRDAIRLSLTSYSKSTCENVRRNALRILHPIEEQNGFALSKLSDEFFPTLIIEGDPKWLATSFHLATYTLLLRISGNTLPESGNLLLFLCSDKVVQSSLATDAYPLRLESGSWWKTWPTLGLMVNKAIESKMSPTGWPKDTDIRTVHNTSGVISAMTCQAGELYRLTHEVAHDRAA